MTVLSARIQALKPSATFAVKAKAAQLRAAGRDVIDLSAGEPDGEPPKAAAAAGLAAIEAGEHRYTPVLGRPELRQAIASRYQRELGLDYGPENVLVTFGGKQALYNLAMALFNPGDEVVLFAPHWVSYLPQFQLVGAVPRVVATRPEDGFQPDLDALRRAITPRTKAILVNSPSNPTGCVIEVERLEAIQRLAAEQGLLVISDEIYGSMTYDGLPRTCMAALHPQGRQNTVLVDAVSKTYAMTGWRVGWLVGPVPIIRACGKLQGHSTSGVCSINQRAAIAALEAPLEYLQPIREALARRRDLLLTGLEATSGIEPGPRPQGAFYLFPRVDGLFGLRTPEGEEVCSGLDVCSFLLETAGVAVVPGEAFGEPRCVRISYALSTEHIREGVRRIQAATPLLT